MDDVSRLQLVGMGLLLTATGAQLFGEGATAWLWAALVAAASAGGVLAWRWRLRASLPIPSVDDLYASAATLGVVLLGFGAIVLLLVVRTELYYAVAHGTVAGWVLVVVAEQSSLKARVQGVTGA